MKQLKLALLAAVSIGGAALAGTASADTTVAWNVGVATDYYFRGLDQTTSSSAGEIFGGVDVTAGAFYAGTWLSSTGPWDDLGLEYDLYAGFRPSAGGINWDFGAIFYGYSDNDSGFISSDFNTFELKAAASVPLGSWTLGAQAYWSPDFAGSGGDGEYLEANAAYTFANHATISGAVGHQFVDDSVYATSGYTTWNLGVSYPLTDHISIDVRYVDQDEEAENFAGITENGTVIGTLKATW